MLGVCRLYDLHLHPHQERRAGSARLPGIGALVRRCSCLRLVQYGSNDRDWEGGWCSVTQRHFDDWSSHQNWGLANVPFRHPWVFDLDADERVTPELGGEHATGGREPGTTLLFVSGGRDFWGERWLKHVEASSYYMRLFRPEKMRYERLVNPVSIADGPVGELDGYLDHHPFSKGMAHWLKRHNSYSSLEAQQIERNRATSQQFSLMQAFLAKDRNQRRFHQKELFYRMPARPVLKFLLLYLGKRGFLDGRRVSITQCCSRFMST